MTSASVFKIDITNGTCTYCVTVLLPTGSAITHNGSVADFYAQLATHLPSSTSLLHIKQTLGQGTACFLDPLIIGATQTVNIAFSGNDILFSNVFKIIGVLPNATPTQVQILPGGVTTSGLTITTTLDAGCCDVAELEFDQCCIDWATDKDAIKAAYADNVHIDWCHSATQPYVKISADDFQNTITDTGFNAVFAAPTERCPSNLTLQQFLNLSGKDCVNTNYHIDWSQVHTLSVVPEYFPLFTTGSTLTIPAGLSSITTLGAFANHLCCNIQNLTILLTPGTYNAADLLALQNAFTAASCASTTCCTSTCTGTGNCHINFSGNDTSNATGDGSGDVVIMGSTTGLNFVGKYTSPMNYDTYYANYLSPGGAPVNNAITVFDLSDSGNLTTITNAVVAGIDFSKMPNITTIIMSGNGNNMTEAALASLNTVSSKTTILQSKLTCLDVSGNAMTTIAANALSKFTALKTFVLDANTVSLSLNGNPFYKDPTNNKINIQVFRLTNVTGTLSIASSIFTGFHTGGADLCFDFSNNTISQFSGFFTSIASAANQSVGNLCFYCKNSTINGGITSSFKTIAANATTASITSLTFDFSGTQAIQAPGIAISSSFTNIADAGGKVNGTALFDFTGRTIKSTASGTAISGSFAGIANSTNTTTGNSSQIIGATNFVFKNTNIAGMDTNKHAIDASFIMIASAAAGAISTIGPTTFAFNNATIASSGGNGIHASFKLIAANSTQASAASLIFDFSGTESIQVPYIPINTSFTNIADAGGVVNGIVSFDFSGRTIQSTASGYAISGSFAVIANSTNTTTGNNSKISGPADFVFKDTIITSVSTSNHVINASFFSIASAVAGATSTITDALTFAFANAAITGGTGSGNGINASFKTIAANSTAASVGSLAFNFNGTQPIQASGHAISASFINIADAGGKINGAALFDFTGRTIKSTISGTAISGSFAVIANSTNTTTGNNSTISDATTFRFQDTIIAGAGINNHAINASFLMIANAVAGATSAITEALTFMFANAAITGGTGAGNGINASFKTIAANSTTTSVGSLAFNFNGTQPIQASGHAISASFASIANTGGQVTGSVVFDFMNRTLKSTSAGNGIDSSFASIAQGAGSQIVGNVVFGFNQTVIASAGTGSAANSGINNSFASIARNSVTGAGSATIGGDVIFNFTESKISDSDNNTGRNNSNAAILASFTNIANDATATNTSHIVGNLTFNFDAASNTTNTIKGYTYGIRNSFSAIGNTSTSTTPRPIGAIVTFNFQGRGIQNSSTITNDNAISAGFKNTGKSTLITIQNIICDFRSGKVTGGFSPTIDSASFGSSAADGVYGTTVTVKKNGFSATGVADLCTQFFPIITGMNCIA